MRLFVTKGTVAFLVPLLALALFTPNAQAGLSEMWSFNDGVHTAAATASISGNVLTVTLSNLSSVKTDEAVLGLGGFYFDMSGATVVTDDPLATASGRVVTYSKNGSAIVSDTGSAVDVRDGWGYDAWTDAGVFPHIGIAAAGNGGLTSISRNIGDSITGVNLDGPDYLLVSAATSSTGDGFKDGVPVVWETVEVSFHLLTSPTDVTWGSGVFTYGTAPEFITPLPGAVLLGMLGLGAAGLKLRKYA
jgi:hypothetical protein